MDMEPKTEREHIISLQGHITGVKKDIAVIKDNHLAHLDEKIDKIYWVVLSTVGAVGLMVIETLLSML